MKRQWIIFFVGLCLIAMSLVAPAQAAPVNQTIPLTPTPTTESCAIRYRIPTQESVSGLTIQLSAMGSPGPGWRVVKSSPHTVIAQGTLTSAGQVLVNLNLEWDVNYSLQIQVGANNWYSSPSCQFRYQTPPWPLATNTPTPAPTATRTPTPTPTPNICWEWPPFEWSWQGWVYGYVREDGALVGAGRKVEAVDDQGMIIGCQATRADGILPFMPLYPNPKLDSGIKFLLDGELMESSPQIPSWWELVSGDLLFIELDSVPTPTETPTVAPTETPTATATSTSTPVPTATPTPPAPIFLLYLPAITR